MTGGRQRISLVLPGEPVTVGEQVVQPVARLAGWLQPFGANGGGALLRLSPEAVIVQRHGQQQTLSLADPTRNTLRSFLLISGAVTLLCLFVMLLTRLIASRRQTFAKSPPSL